MMVTTPAGAERHYTLSYADFWARLDQEPGFARWFDQARRRAAAGRRTAAAAAAAAPETCCCCCTAQMSCPDAPNGCFI